MSSWRPAILASDRLVACDACCTGLSSFFGELIEQTTRGAEIDLVWCLTSEGGVWHDGVVLLDVESDELHNGVETIKLVQEKPPVFQGSPPGLDHGVGKGDFDLSEDAAQRVIAQQSIDKAIDVFPILIAALRHCNDFADLVDSL